MEGVTEGILTNGVPGRPDAARGTSRTIASRPVWEGTREVQMNKKRTGGFTLVELIIVIIILGILAALALPQFSTSTQDASEATLQGNLQVMRNAISLYYHQHNSTFPGANDAKGVAKAAGDKAGFVAQMTQYSNKTGDCVTTKDAAHPYGPYLMSRQIPVNPLAPPLANTEPLTRDIELDNAAGKLTGTADATAAAGWRFSVVTGEFIANNVLYDTF